MLVVLLALALGMVGYGHRMALPALDLSAYAMPDGTIPVLCLVGGQESSKSAAEAPCPACVISAMLQMPPVGTLPAVDLTATLIEWPAPASVSGMPPPARAPPARGPPMVSLI